MAEWETREVCMAIKAYPNPVQDLGEAVCTAGVDRNGTWVRVYPVLFRDLPMNKRFAKYQWIHARFKKSSDPRPESYEVDHDSIVCLETVDTEKATWKTRKALITPHIVESVEVLQLMAMDNIQTMGYVRPVGVPELLIEDREKEWTPDKKGMLAQAPLFTRPKATLERIPYRFAYRYACEGTACKKSHNMQVLDWEMHESYRSWRNRYGDPGWREKFIEKYGPTFFEKNDVLFNLGNLAKYPQSLCITGLFYPRRTV